MGDKIRLLLVEDEQTLAGIIADTLSEKGFEVTVAYDGEAGLRAFRGSRPDVVVSDVMMPCMDGFTFVGRLRREAPGVPVLFLSARSAAEDVVQGFETGGNERQRLSCDGVGTELSARESEVLQYLCRNAGEIVPMKTLLVNIWGDDSFFNARSLHVFITRLRHRLVADPSIQLVNVRGVGYKLLMR